MTLRHIFIAFLALVGLVLAIAGFRGSISRKPPIELFADMARQPRLRPQAPSEMFSDGRGSRSQPEGTVARGMVYSNLPINTGHTPDNKFFVETNPLPITPELLALGRDRFGVFCATCHGLQADGNSVSRKIGAMPIVANLHDKRIAVMTDGELFNTVSNGKNLMSAYGNSLSVQERWAVIAYVRALQLSRLGNLQDVPSELRDKLK